MVAIRSLNDVSQALGASFEHGGLVVGEADLCPEFFDLRTGFAGEVLQKFVNYRARLALVVPDPETHGKRFGELAYEHRTHSLIRFFRTEQEARTWLEAAQTGR